jgi:hypothetical protein
MSIVSAGYNYAIDIINITNEKKERRGEQRKER